MTWGISGPLFLGLYATALALLIAATVGTRAVLRRGTPTAPRNLNLDEIAYLSGGARLVGTSALVGLQEAGSVTGSATALVTSGPPPPSGSAVQHGLYRKLSTGGPVDSALARRTASNDQSVAAIRTELQRLGLVPDPTVTSRLQRCALGLWALVALGVARLIAGLNAGRPVGLLVLLLLVAVVAAIALARVPRLTDPGKEAVRQVRGQREALRSGGLPGDRALAVALFGAGVLWLADAQLAGMLGMRREAAAAGGDALASSCGSGDGGSSSCGSGSSCSSGSSCGGGCGGGGCGG